MSCRASRAVSDAERGREPEIEIRQATPDDSSLLLEWANDTDTRASSLSTSKIEFEEHEQWFAARLQDRATRIWIGLVDGRPVGQVRLEVDAQGAAEVSIAMAPAWRGRGLSRPLLEAAVRAAQEPGGLAYAVLVAHVRPENEASRSLFERAGFEPSGTVNVRGVSVLEFRRQRAPEHRATIRLVASPPVAGDLENPNDAAADLTVVLDPAWTTPDNVIGGRPRIVGVRDLAGIVLAERDLFDETTARLDDWAEAARVADLLSVDGVSYWYRRRLGYWWWLQARLLWLGIFDAAIASLGSSGTGVRLELPGRVDAAIRDVAELVADAEGMDLVRAARSGLPSPGNRQGSRVPVLRRVHAAGVVDRLRAFRAQARAAVRRWRVDRRLRRLRRKPGKVLVLSDWRSVQPIETPSGSIVGNPFLEPVFQALAGSRLDALRLDDGSDLNDADYWRAQVATGRDRSLPVEVLETRFADAADDIVASETAATVESRLVAITEPLQVGDVDLGPRLVGEIVRSTRASLPRILRDLARARRFLQAVRPAALVLINEYGRTEWIAACRAEQVQVAAVQHGIIHRHHPGYVHAFRSPELPLPDRLYVFGQFERRLLTTRSVYHAEEVVVAGSPRLDVFDATSRRHPAVLDLRSSLGVAASDRLLAVSTTFGLIRQFHMPVAMAALLDGELERVHLVIKVHPNEPDDDFYQRLIAGIRAAAGRRPVPVTVVRSIDLYRLLAASDVHLGLYSTVLTEAVVTGTPNLVSMVHATSDLLGYVEAGVALPVRDGTELGAAIDVAVAQGLDPRARAAFLRDHFEPGTASRRIAEDLQAWLASGSGAQASLGRSNRA